MNHFKELPLIINEVSKQKYNSYTIYQTNSRFSLNKYKKTKKENSNPFRCLNRIPQNQNSFTHKNIRSLHPTPSDLNPTKSYESTNSMMSTLPPLLTVTAPRGIALKAYEQIHLCARRRLKQNCSEQTVKQVLILKQLHGSSASINRKIAQLTKKGTVILQPALNIIYHTLQAELSLKQQSMKDAVWHFQKAQFYSLQIQQYLFAIYCMIEIADIYKSQSNYQKGVSSLKNALGLSITIDNRELQLTVLEKIGMLHYYNGNTAMCEQYHRLAERGLTAKELQIFKNEFNLAVEYRHLERQLFSLTPKVKTTKKLYTKEEEEINTDLQQESTQQNSALTHDMVTSMMKDNSQKNIGIKLKNHIRNTQSLAKIIPYSHSPPKQYLRNENLPFFNVSQVLKSHLSKNRGTRSEREWEIRSLLQMIDSIVRLI